MAATTAIGAPSLGGVPQLVYVAARLRQWSNSPSPGCGRDNFRSAWVGCVHPDGSRGWGNDAPDSAWRDGVQIDLKCDPGDTVGIYKYSWGFFSGQNCAREATLVEVRNHDSIPSCSY